MPFDPAQAFGKAMGHFQAGRRAEAEDACRGILAIAPRHADSLHLAGVIAYLAGRDAEALDRFETAIAVNDAVADYHVNRGNVLLRLGRPDQALGAYENAERLRADLALVHCNRSSALTVLGRYDEALAAADRALRLEPQMTEALANRADALQGAGRHEDAVTAYQAVLCLRPDHAEAQANRGAALQQSGRPEQAVAAYRTALRIRPLFPDAHSNLIMCLHYRADGGPDEILTEARRFAALHEPGTPPSRFPNAPDPHRRLRVGYVSGDFGHHPVGVFLEPVFVHHDPAAVALFCYATRRRDDALTGRLHRRADGWRDIATLSDADAAAVIAGDGIDILVDLAGHTAHNRLPLFARKPAPVQVTWLGFWGTTGLSAIDTILSDAVTIAPGEERFYSETVWRLAGGRFCYTPPAYAPEPAPPPCLTGRGTTFGSFNNLTKVGAETIALWAGVLRAVPEARLLVKWPTLVDPRVCDRFRASFAAAGVAPDRMELRGGSPHQAMLAELGAVDIALDPYPFSGGLTSCEALWMGVPVVTLPGPAAPSRQTAAFLRAVGLGDLAAVSAEDYIAIAAALAADRARLLALRRSLRGLMTASPLCDGAGFTRNLENAYRQMWRAWCLSMR